MNASKEKKTKKKDLFTSELSPTDTKRYLRQLVLDECTPKNQKKLFATRILVVGLGGLGIPVCLYLVGSGVKHIGIADGDKIEMTNLHRQVIYNEEDIGKSKVSVMKDKLLKMNTELTVKTHNEFVIKDNVQMVNEYDIIVDCSDNISTRYLLNDNTRDKQFVCASVLRWNGEIYLFSKNDACYRCLYPIPKSNPESCNESGIVGGICGVIGSLLSVEIIKMIFFETRSKLLIYDGKEGEIKNVKLREKQNTCLACNKKAISTNITLNYKQLVRVDEKYKISWNKYFDNTSKYDLIDVRKEKMFVLAHVKGSRNIPIDSFNLDKLTKKMPLVVCAKGISAQAVARTLLDNNIDCRVVKDGLVSFKRDIDPDFPL
ncbi:hypothetical protein VCUG_00889 [Vavraia culicis subsp. floridensis]|uniref:Rhodanese domain-containing protein n=1 Tax=Vavraia culicis (isolate floridensis) TaxID=948595 RepID=L2GV73_VAVCU|nr:uncharacterized protein VCUG_00889 [Vavraia culicis subsp. floridensis]ELA47566.1 hypothetical protein VCUG_00889 [Vavraia culicis subsp. floridensis]